MHRNKHTEKYIETKIYKYVKLHKNMMYICVKIHKIYKYVKIHKNIVHKYVNIHKEDRQP